MAGWSLDTSAQQPAMPVVGFLSSGSRELDASRLTAFRQGLNEAGYVEGRNVAIEGSWAENHTERLPALATDLARRPVTVAAAGISGTGGQDSDHDDPDRLRNGCRPGRDRIGPQLEPTWWQPHRSDRLGCRAGAEASGASACGGDNSAYRCPTRQSGQSQCQNSAARTAGGGAQARTSAPCPPREQ